MSNQPEWIPAMMSVLMGADAQMCGIAALTCAETQKMCKQKGEKDTEFVKRIARSYNQYAMKIFTDHYVKLLAPQPPLIEGGR